MKFETGDKVIYSQEYIDWFKPKTDHHDLCEFLAWRGEIADRVHNGVYRLANRRLIHESWLELAQ
jgi:hypothetical protein